MPQLLYLWAEWSHLGITGQCFSTLLHLRITGEAFILFCIWLIEQCKGLHVPITQFQQIYKKLRWFLLISKKYRTCKQYSNAWMPLPNQNWFSCKLVKNWRQLLVQRLKSGKVFGRLEECQGGQGGCGEWGEGRAGGDEAREERQGRVPGSTGSWRPLLECSRIPSLIPDFNSS